MPKSCVTIALVPEIKKGPWIYWDNVELSVPKAKSLGYDAIELFTASGHVDPSTDVLKNLLDETGLTVAAVGTGAGKVIKSLTLIDPEEKIRAAAIQFITEMIQFGALFSAPAIIGSMQGVIDSDQERVQALSLLAQGLNHLAEKAKDFGVKLIYEPLNRYETNLFNTLGEAVEFLKTLKTDNICLLADLFHMNIEEVDIADAIRKNAEYIGHIHFADSNRRPVGFGHTNMRDIVKVIEEIGYDGYISAEAFPYPNPDAAAKQTIKAYNECFQKRE